MMNKNADMVNLKKLITTGKNKGYVTFEELNDDLSEEIISSEEQIDDLMMMFEELDIMVIDDNTKKKIEKRKTQKMRELNRKTKMRLPLTWPTQHREFLIRSKCI